MRRRLHVISLQLVGDFPMDEAQNICYSVFPITKWVPEDFSPIKGGT